jgi:hypothetical protein
VRALDLVQFIDAGTMLALLPALTAAQFALGNFLDGARCSGR